MKTVAVLFAREDSIYKSFASADVYDMERDARTFRGGLPVVAHPPCRAWGRLRHFAKPRFDEEALAFFAVDNVRLNGGVLEHPAGSLLWTAARLPLPGERDQFGGFTMPILQSWFGHKAPKNTWLYIVGIEPSQIPSFPMQLGKPLGRIQDNGSKKFREATPQQMAVWLLDVATHCTPSPLLRRAA